MITQSLNFQTSGEDMSLLLEICRETGKEPKDIFADFLQSLKKTSKSKPHRQAGALAHMNIHTDDALWFEPMSDEELALWNGDKTDKYGISL